MRYEVSPFNLLLWTERICQHTQRLGLLCMQIFRNQVIDFFCALKKIVTPLFERFILKKWELSNILLKYYYNNSYFLSKFFSQPKFINDIKGSKILMCMLIENSYNFKFSYADYQLIIGLTDYKLIGKQIRKIKI